MSHVKGRDTRPELLVRSLVHRLGYRFRLHRRDLPGCPDLVLPRHQTVILVHGCFWHQHPGCRRATMPATNREFWQAKLSGNAERDRRNQAALTTLGWRVLVVWECETRDVEALRAQLAEALTTPHAP